jgi:hypothetical protein
MITIEIAGLAAVERRFDEMIEKIEQLRSHDLSAELGAWEVGDMNRRRAYTKRRRNGGSTIIRAHS